MTNTREAEISAAGAAMCAPASYRPPKGEFGAATLNRGSAEDEAYAQIKHAVLNLHAAYGKVFETFKDDEKRECGAKFKNGRSLAVKVHDSGEIELNGEKIKQAGLAEKVSEAIRLSAEQINALKDAPRPARTPVLTR